MFVVFIVGCSSPPDDRMKVPTQRMEWHIDGFRKGQNIIVTRFHGLDSGG